MAGGGLRLTLLVCAIPLSLVACGTDTTRDAARSGGSQPDHSTVVRLDAESGDVLDVFPTGPGPLHLVVASGHIWTQNFGDGSLTHVDPEKGTAVAVNAGEVAGLASDGEDLWVARDGNVLARLDGATGKERIALEPASRPLFAVGRAGFVAVGGGSVWLTVPPEGAASEELWRIDPHDGNVLARIPIGTEANPPFVHGRNLWVVTREDQALTRVDMRTNEAERVQVGPHPWALAVAGGDLWISHHVRPMVVREGSTGAEETNFPFETDPRGMAYGGRRLWVATEDGLYAIDPAKNLSRRIADLGPFPDDAGPIGVAYLDGSVWVSIE